MCSRYNTLSTGACASIAYGYFRFGRKQGPRLWSATGAGARGAAVALQALGLAGFSQLLPRLQVPLTTDATPAPAGGPRTSSGGGGGSDRGGLRVRCPMDFKPADLPEDGIYGLKRVTRHPTFWSMGVFGLGAALATPFATEVAMFSMPALFALIGTAHQDSRFRRHMGGELPPEVDALTSNLPFAALLQGRQSWSALAEEVKWLNCSVAVAGAMLLALGRRGGGARFAARR